MEDLLGPAILAVNKCFVGLEGGLDNALARTRVGPGNSWWLSVVLERTVGGMDGGGD